MADDVGTLKLPLGLLWGAQPLDIVTTGVLLSAGAGREGNPVTAALLAVGGLGLVLVVKLALCGVITASAVKSYSIEPLRSRQRVALVASIYVAVVVWNVSLITGRMVLR